MFTTYEECSNKIKEILNEMATVNKPYVFEGSAHYGGYWSSEYYRPYLTDLKIEDYKYVDYKGFSACANINLTIKGKSLKNSVKISFEEKEGKYTISALFNLDKDIFEDKNQIQMTLLACDLNNSNYLKNIYNPYTLFKYNYVEKYAYIESSKEFVSASEEYISMFLNSALSYDFIFGRFSWIQYLYRWIDDLDDADYFMLDEEYDIDDVLRDNIEIREEIDNTYYDL